MELPVVSPNKVRFGIFEADLTAGELRRRGRKVPLQDQPFQVLGLLLRRRGEIVARGELQQTLWPADTFVEFEHGVNTAINKLRRALGDSAENPRFIETVPRKGYRFIAPVETETRAVTPPISVRQSVHSRRKAWPWILAAGAIVTSILVTGLWPVSKTTIRVTPLTNDGRMKADFLVVSAGRVFYSAPALEVSDKLNLWSVPIVGGEPRHEQSPCPAESHGVTIGGVSYLHRRVLLLCWVDQTTDDLWLADFDRGSFQSIGRYKVWDQGVSISPVSISPDLKTLLFSRKKGLYTKLLDGGRERFLGPGEWGEAISPTFWHPSGTRIGFFRPVDGVYKAWEVRVDGTGMRPLLPAFAAEQVPAQWSRDGRRLYFVSEGDIYLQSSRGWLGWMRRPAPVRLTSGPAHFAFPVEDPSNPLVVYAVGEILQATSMKLNRGSNRWEPFLGGIPANAVDYSRDGRWVVYVSFPGGELWKCRSDGTGRVLLEDGLVTMNPRWSPDGTRIAFSARARGAAGESQPFRIYTIFANGGNPMPVPGVPGPAFDPSWSPDGKQLAFSPFPGQVRTEQQKVFLVNLETGAVQAVPGSEGMCFARWSPDGNWLAAAISGKLWPVAYNFRTREWTELRHGLTTHFHWSKDSRYLFGGTPLQGNRLIRIEVATGKVEEIRRITEFTTAGIMAFVPFWTPDDEPIVLKDLSTYQIYRVERDQ